MKNPSIKNHTISELIEILGGSDQGGGLHIHISQNRFEKYQLAQIENNYLQLKQAFKRLEISKKSLIQADENLRLHQDRFKAGTVIGKDVLEAQVLWQQAYSEVIDAKASLQIRQASYKKAIGEIN